MGTNGGFEADFRPARAISYFRFAANPEQLLPDKLGNPAKAGETYCR